MAEHAFDVLLVEDDIDVAEVIGDLLAHFGCRVEWKDNAQAALDRLAEGLVPELILSDIRMPGIKNGIDLANEVTIRWPTMKLVLMTGFTDELQRLSEQQRRNVMLKPIDRRKLLSLVSEARNN